MADMYSSVYNPDVLSCLANLSNDEVFTPPAVVNAMLGTCCRRSCFRTRTRHPSTLCVKRVCFCAKLQAVDRRTRRGNPRFAGTH